MRLLFLVIILFLFDSLSERAYLYGQVNERDDFQIWLYDSVNRSLGRYTKIFAEAEIRYGDSASKAYYFYVQSRIQRNFSKRFELSLGYRHEMHLNTARSRWETIYKPLFDIYLKADLGKWRLIDRNRIFYYFFEIRHPNIWEYRNRAQLFSPWYLGKMKFNPWIYSEVFFREGEGFGQHRLALGGNFPISPHLEGSIFYILRHRKVLDEWRHHNVIGGYLFFSF